MEARGGESSGAREVESRLGEVRGPEAGGAESRGLKAAGRGAGGRSRVRKQARGSMELKTGRGKKQGEGMRSRRLNKS